MAAVVLALQAIGIERRLAEDVVVIPVFVDLVLVGVHVVDVLIAFFAQPSVDPLERFRVQHVVVVEQANELTGREI